MTLGAVRGSDDSFQIEIDGEGDSVNAASPTKRGRGRVPSSPKAENFTSHQPVAFVLDGRRHEVVRWREVFSGVCEILATDADTDFHQRVAQVRGRSRVYFSKDPAVLHHPLRLAETGLFVEGNFSANDSVKILSSAEDPAMATTQAAPEPSSAVDGVLMAVLTKRLEGIVTKMHNTLLRTARSGVINTARDFSCCILTGDCRLLTIGESLPIHTMLGTDVMARTMKDFHPDLRRGDAFLHNSPYHGNTHAADLAVLAPVIDEGGAHRFTVLAKAHQADIGNSIPTTYMATARDVYEEGALIFPAVKVQSDYRDIDDIVRMCMLRIRVPEQWRGDYLAGLGAARIGEREITALAAEVGWDTLEAHVEAWLDYSERQMIAAVRRLPSGTATGRCVHDPFPGTPPEGIPVKATVTVDSDAAMIDVDLRDNIDCVPCGLNLSEACASSSAMIGIFNGINAADVPTNAGSFRRVRVHLKGELRRRHSEPSDELLGGDDQRCRPLDRCRADRPCGARRRHRYGRVRIGANRCPVRDLR